MVNMLLLMLYMHDYSIYLKVVIGQGGKFGTTEGCGFSLPRCEVIVLSLQLHCTALTSIYSATCL